MAVVFASTLKIAGMVNSGMSGTFTVGCDKSSVVPGGREGIPALGPGIGEGVTLSSKSGKPSSSESEKPSSSARSFVISNSSLGRLLRKSSFFSLSNNSFVFASESFVMPMTFSFGLKVYACLQCARASVTYCGMGLQSRRISSSFGFAAAILFK